MSAVVVTLRRVGWHVMDHEPRRCHDGSILGSFDAAPWVVKKLLLRAIELCGSGSKWPPRQAASTQPAAGPLSRQCGPRRRASPA
eukprot:2780349-Pyramimonas_sp.AAC.1